MIKATLAAPPEPSKGGIPSQLKKLNERIDQLEQLLVDSLGDLQRVIDDEVLPALRIAAAKAEAAMEVAAKVASEEVARRGRPNRRPDPE